jgi:hypothetical protein
MADRHQLRSGFGCRSADGAAAVSLEGLVVVVVDGVCDIDELLLSLGAVVLGMVVLGVVAAGLVAGVEVVLESAGRVAASLVDCA